MAKVTGVNDERLAETFLVNIGLPNNVIFSSIRVSKGNLPGADVLIGMDIIGRGDFSVTNAGGITKFSYRTPSIEHIDYYEQVEKIRKQAKTSPSRAERRRKKFGRK